MDSCCPCRARSSRPTAAWRNTPARSGWSSARSSTSRALADDVKPGKWTSFPQSVKLKTRRGGRVLLRGVQVAQAARPHHARRSWSEPRFKKYMDPKKMPFDGKRMFWGGFKTIVGTDMQVMLMCCIDESRWTALPAGEPRRDHARLRRLGRGDGAARQARRDRQARAVRERADDPPERRKAPGRRRSALRRRRNSSADTTCSSAATSTRRLRWRSGFPRCRTAASVEVRALEPAA